MPSVELWQAVLLSLDVEPEPRLEREAKGPRTDYSRLPAEYWDRLMVCRANLSTRGPIRPQGSPYNGMLGPHCPVLAAEVGAFLAGEGLAVPDAMLAAKSAGLDSPASDEQREPLQRQTAQEQELLRTLRRLHYEPQALPKPAAGQPGPKSDARKALQAHALFIGEKVFDKAWERLRKAGEIRDKA